MSTPRTKHITDLDTKAGSFKLDGIPYHTSALPEAIKPALVTLALSQLLARAKNPGATYADLTDGRKTFDQKPKAEAYTDWHKAAAGVHALGVVKANGVKAKPGKSLRDGEEYAAAYADALKAMLPWTREKTENAKKHPEVFAEHRRITDAVPVSMEALFGVPVVEPTPEPVALAMDEAA